MISLNITLILIFSNWIKLFVAIKTYDYLINWECWSVIKEAYNIKHTKKDWICVIYSRHKKYIDIYYFYFHLFIEKYILTMTFNLKHAKFTLILFRNF